MADRARPIVHRVTADRSRPQSDADHAARRGDRLEPPVVQVARTGAGAGHARMRHDDGPTDVLQDVVDEPWRRMRQVHDHAEPFGALEDAPAELREPALPEPVRGASYRVVEEVREPEHPEARLEQPVE